MAEPLTRAQVLSALNAGTLQMMRPWGDFVPVRLDRMAFPCEQSKYIAFVRMEREVGSQITITDERLGFPHLRIAPRAGVQ